MSPGAITSRGGRAEKSIALSRSASYGVHVNPPFPPASRRGKVRSVLLRLLSIAMLAALAGCSRGDAASDLPAPGSKERAAARMQRARDLAAKPPGVTRHHTDAGDLLVMEVPIVLPGGLPDTQHCFVWRDAELHSASISCPANVDVGSGRHGE